MHASPALPPLQAAHHALRSQPRIVRHLATGQASLSQHLGWGPLRSRTSSSLDLGRGERFSLNEVGRTVADNR